MVESQQFLAGCHGLKLIKDIDYIEGTDLSEEYSKDEQGNITALPQRRKGAKTKQFTLMAPRPNCKLTYKITTNGSTELAQNSTIAAGGTQAIKVVASYTDNSNLLGSAVTYSGAQVKITYTQA